MNSIKEADFTEALANVAELVYRYSSTLRAWDKDEEKAKADVAAGSLSSFTIDKLVWAASTQSPRYNIQGWLRKVDETCTRSEIGRVTEVQDEAKLVDLVQYFNDYVTDQFTDWYRPNSTSNVDVEIKLGQHEAWKELFRIASGRRF